MERAEIAAGIFESGFNCAQSVFASFSNDLELTRDFALRAATGFGGGMGRNQRVCGAVSGGIMALNLLFGRGTDDDSEMGVETYRIVREFMAEFAEKNKTVVCKELLDGCELMTDEGQARYESENMRELCTSYIASAAEILEGVIERNRTK